MNAIGGLHSLGERFVRALARIRTGGALPEIDQVCDATKRNGAFIIRQDDIAPKQDGLEARDYGSRFRDVADTAPIMIWICNSDRLYTNFSRRCLELTELTLVPELGIGCAEEIHPQNYSK